MIFVCKIFRQFFVIVCSIMLLTASLVPREKGERKQTNVTWKMLSKRLMLRNVHQSEERKRKEKREAIPRNGSTRRDDDLRHWRWIFYKTAGSASERALLRVEREEDTIRGRDVNFNRGTSNDVLFFHPPPSTHRPLPSPWFVSVLALIPEKRCKLRGEGKLNGLAAFPSLQSPR